jgi:TPR repeat protein
MNAIRAALIARLAPLALAAALNVGSGARADRPVATADPAAATPTECDRLAGDPSDPDKAGSGVPDVQLLEWNDAAILACQRALQTDPGNARLHYNLGRALFLRNRHTEALRESAVAAEQKHRQAEFVLGLWYTDGIRGESAPDPCLALPLWRDAAERGHYAARISLAHEWLRGRYRSCSGAPDHAAIESMLRGAAAIAESDYYQRLLVDELSERLKLVP